MFISGCSRFITDCFGRLFPINADDDVIPRDSKTSRGEMSKLRQIV